MKTIFLDIGGTFIKCSDGRSVPIDSGGSGEAIAAALRQACDVSGPIGRLGVAIPGPFDYSRGIFRADHKFAAVKGLSLRELAGLPESVDIRYRHDVCSALEGSVAMLGLRETNTAIVSIGTGLGFAVAEKGEVRYSPTLSPADSIWNLPWEGGILEDKVSARGLRALYAARGGDPDLSAKSVSVRAGRGDVAALEAWYDMGDILGTVLQPILERNAISDLLFAGQVSKSFDLMEDALLRHIGKQIHIGQAPQGAVFEGIKKLFQ